MNQEKGRLPGRPSAYSTNNVDGGLLWRAYRIARYEAAKRGCDRNAAEDIATGYIEHLLVCYDRLLVPVTEPYQTAWLFRCAANWAANGKRQRLAYLKREQSWSDTGDTEGQKSLEDLAVDERSPEVELITRELIDRIDYASTFLPSRQRELYMRRYRFEESISELAIALNQSPNTIRQALWAVRQRLRTILREQGLSDHEVREYCYIAARAHTNKPYIAISR